MKRSGCRPVFEGVSKQKRVKVSPSGKAGPSPLAQKALSSLQEVLQSMDAEARRASIQALPPQVREVLLAFMEGGAVPVGLKQKPGATCITPSPRTPAARSICTKVHVMPGATSRQALQRECSAVARRLVRTLKRRQRRPCKQRLTAKLLQQHKGERLWFTAAQFRESWQCLGIAAVEAIC